MKKLSNVIRVNNELNKFDNFIFDNLDSCLNGDWSDYKNGDKVVYKVDCMEMIDDDFSFIDDWNEYLDEDEKINLDELKEYIGKGICYIDENWSDDRCWYNVKFKDNILNISYIVDLSLS
jgi:hypothetical protein